MEVTYYKSSEKDKLVVNYAASLENEIRFYINDTQYFGASYQNKELSVGFGEETEDEMKKQSPLKIIKENKKLVFICVLGILLSLGMVWVIGYLIDNILAFLLTINTTILIINIITTGVCELASSSPSIKSKHSAEHMMVNFLQKHKRLPKSIEEVKTASRFSKWCGTSEDVEGIVSTMISTVISTIIAIIASGIYRYFSEDDHLNGCVIAIAFVVADIIIKILLKKCEKLESITKPLTIFFSNLFQRLNTTKKVEDKDIILAYLAAKLWMELVYPEYYNEEDEDVFIKDMKLRIRYKI